MIRSGDTSTSGPSAGVDRSVVLGLDQDLVGGNLEPAGLGPGRQAAGGVAATDRARRPASCRPVHSTSWPETATTWPARGSPSGGSSHPDPLALARFGAVIGPAVDQEATPGPVGLEARPGDQDRTKRVGKIKQQSPARRDHERSARSGRDRSGTSLAAAHRWSR